MEYKVGDRYEILEVLYGGNKYSKGRTITIIKEDEAACKNDWRYTPKFYKLKKLEEPMFKEGDVITNDGCTQSTVLAVCGKVFARTTYSQDNHHVDFKEWLSFKQAKEFGWKLYEPPKDTVTLTTEDGNKIEISKQSLEGLKKL